jgi:hypothetical protein
MGDQLRDPSEGEWLFGKRNAAWMSVLAMLIIAPGLFGFGRLSLLLGAGRLSVIVPHDQLGLAIAAVIGIVLGIYAATLALFLLHEWCHGLAFRAMGATPHYGAKMMTWFFPVFYAASPPGHWFTRWQLLVVLLAPTVAVNLLGMALLVVLGSWSWILVLPLAIHLGGCIGDWWISVVVLRLPAGTLIGDSEDSTQGFRYKVPPKGGAETPSRGGQVT